MKHLLLLLLLISCGKNSNDSLTSFKSGHIVGGREAVPGDKVLLSTVGLLRIKSNNIRKACTGTLISPDLVLTAGHCIKSFHLDDPTPAKEMAIWPSGHMPSEGFTNVDHGKMIGVESYIVHPSFFGILEKKNPEDNYDIALLKLSRKIPADKRFVSLVSSRNNYPEGTNIFLAGYGLIDNIAENGHVRPPKENTQLRVTNNYIYQYNTGTFEVDQSNRRGTCFGDSGGPAYIEKNNELVLFGITSGPTKYRNQRVVSNEVCYLFISYTDVSEHRDFIERSAKKLNAISPKFVD